jgi:membrane protease YdiL (CAAX protease family)
MKVRRRLRVFGLAITAAIFFTLWLGYAITLLVLLPCGLIWGWIWRRNASSEEMGADLRQERSMPRRDR